MYSHSLPKHRYYWISLEILAMVAFFSNSPAKIDDGSTLVKPVEKISIVDLEAKVLSAAERRRLPRQNQPYGLRNAASQIRSVQGEPRTRHSMSDREFGGQSYPTSTHISWLTNI